MLELLGSAAVLVLLDQGSKRVMCARGAEPAFVWGAILRIQCVLNRNRMYQRPRARAALAATWLLAVSSAAALYFFRLHFQTGAALAGLGLALGGSASNLFDILRNQAIVDFIDLGWWPAFNLADAAIVVGLALAISQ